ncbi:MarR family transcriptional regulator [Solibacillus sp. R5-41]|uniref:MarR family winged helix-turn-helix transcriptional regulator n=1 Tax=Solibacillus sp. R5-41 TaxID=2048654 RepID=UPI000C1267B1|nr:MarR family transcriptional regulator [Solibacillus sp. R5-41]ATP39969.1 MarR family transcriptional regulator [Solibacillus sp. R5-41]
MSDYNKQLKAFTVLLRAANAVQEVSRQDITENGLNLTEFAVLELLYHKGDQPIQIIGKRVLIASSSITYVVDKLENRGFVQRLACPDDRRVTFASLTNAGLVFIESIFPKHEQKVAQIFNILTEEELDTFIKLTKRIGLQNTNL